MRIELVRDISGVLLVFSTAMIAAIYAHDGVGFISTLSLVMTAYKWGDKYV